MAEEKKTNPLDILLSMPNRELVFGEIKIKELSKLTGQDVIFKVKNLGYDKVKSLRSEEENDIHIVLAGVVEPDLKSVPLMDKYEAQTPAELVKSMLLPGEIADVAIAIEKLTGFRRSTIEDFKKK